MIETGDGQRFDEDKRYSFRDHTGHDLTGRKDMDGLVIARACFSRETFGDAFPPSMKGAVFVECNLDNCAIPPGNSVVQCSTRRFAVQNDRHDWEVDERGAPVKRLDEIAFTKRGLPAPQPEDLPDELLDVATEPPRLFELVTVKIPPEKLATFEQFLAAEAIAKDGA